MGVAESTAINLNVKGGGEIQLLVSNSTIYTQSHLAI